ncbi:platelet basic protein isoform X3 [Pipistrellus kuhlii]|uniref:platelet basic protein isoform X3 n=1 Tax=Pipistrellus kuhlii TaxID=59472 RepID=UPI001E27339A|nr:platelet basic protein isoform X3 [Pipistrellus kuhlii]
MGVCIKDTRRARKPLSCKLLGTVHAEVSRFWAQLQVYSSVLSAMNLRPRATSAPVLQVLLQLSLLLTAMVPFTLGEGNRNLEEAEVSIPAGSVQEERYAELRCTCIQTTSGIHPKNIQTLKMFKAGPHCPNIELIATLKNGKKICLDPNAPMIKKIIQKILEGDESAA